MERRLDHVKQRLDVERRLGDQYSDQDSDQDQGARRGPFIPRAVKERSTACHRVCVMARAMESECNVGDDGGVDILFVSSTRGNWGPMLQAALMPFLR